jgi:CheY-like chemotaxis protein
VSRRKLLLADDSITIQKVVNLTFADEGIDVVTVGDGDAALAQLASETPDILLADVNMPGPTGYEICEQLRANEATRGVPVILLVGSFEPFDEAEATRVGANAYLTKPFQSIKQLIAQVNELMDAASPTEPQVVTEEPAPVEQAPIGAVPPISSESIAPDNVASGTGEPAPKYFDDLGYESAPAGETAEPEAPAPDDIDRLYEQSVAGTANDDLSDVGIDDEMIETSYSAAQADDEIGLSSQSAPTSEFSRPHEEGQAEIERIEIAQVDPSPAESGHEGDDAGFRSGYEQRFPDDPSKFENTISYENWKPADMREEGSEGIVSSTVAASALSNEGHHPEEPQPVKAVQHGPTVGEETIRMENRFDTTGASFKFDDVDLLDLSNGGQNQVEITSPAHAIEQGASKQVVTLSPELIEMIAQRVVEKLSEKY